MEKDNKSLRMINYQRLRMKVKCHLSNLREGIESRAQDQGLIIRAVELQYDSHLWQVC